MCVACGDISGTQATVSALPTFLLAYSPLFFFVWYKLSRVITIRKIVVANSYKDFFAIVFAIQTLFFILTLILLVLWPFSLVSFVLIFFALFFLLWGIVGHSFMQQKRKTFQIAITAIYSSLACGVIAVPLYIISVLQPNFGSSGLLQELFLFLAAASVVFVYGILIIIKGVKRFFT